MLRNVIRSRLSLAIVLFIALVGFQTQSSIAKEKAKSSNYPASVEELKSLQDTVEKTVKKVLPSVVGVQVGPARGSGVIISKDGYVMTAGHVVGRPGQKVTFTFSDGETAEGVTLGMFKSFDAGLMRIKDCDDLPFVEKGVSADLKSGDWCIASGHPLGYQPGRPPVVRVGRILRVNEDAVQTDCPLVGGDSGGPLFDLEGRVIGINSRIGPRMEMNFHVPVDVFTTNWERLAKGDQWEVSLPARDCDEIKDTYKELMDKVSSAVCRIRCDGKDVALGTIVGPDGWVITKASELKGEISCTLRDGRVFTPKWIGTCETIDVAMLKLDAFDLPHFKWKMERPEVGSWLASAGISDEPIGLGVVSVPVRRIPPQRGMLGVVLSDEDDRGAKVEKVVDNSPASKAGLHVGDIITHVNGVHVEGRRQLVMQVYEMPAGTKVDLKVKRGDEDLDIEATLGIIKSENEKKQMVQNRMGVGVSKRTRDFPAVMQHDTVLKPTDCGGPVVDLSGNVVGINIARAGRTETYALPSDLILSNMYPLMSGLMTPPHVAEARKKAAENEEDEAAEDPALAQKPKEELTLEEKLEILRAAKKAQEKADEGKSDESSPQDKPGDNVRKSQPDEEKSDKDQMKPEENEAQEDSDSTKPEADLSEKPESNTPSEKSEAKPEEGDSQEKKDKPEGDKKEEKPSKDQESKSKS